MLRYLDAARGHGADGDRYQRVALPVARRVELEHDAGVAELADRAVLLLDRLVDGAGGLVDPGEVVGLALGEVIVHLGVAAVEADADLPAVGDDAELVGAVEPLV